MFEDIIDERKSRRNFYRNYYRVFSKALYVCMCVIMLELALLFLIWFFRGTPDFYINAQDGRVEQIFSRPFGVRLKETSDAVESGTNISQASLTEAPHG